MISPTGKIEELLAAVAQDSHATIIERIKAEKREAETRAKAQAKIGRHEGMHDYVQLLTCLLFWLMARVKARNCSCFELFRPLTESLVSQGVFDPGTLAAFDAGGGENRKS
jgi:hypothetical protein